MNRLLGLSVATFLIISAISAVVDSMVLRLLGTSITLVLFVVYVVMQFRQLAKEHELKISEMRKAQSPVLAPMVEVLEPRETRVVRDIAGLVKDIKELRSLIRNLQQANSAGTGLIAMADQQKNSITNIISDSNVIQINANQAYAIADNIAGNANQAFALSEQVQEKVAALGVEMTDSLKETEFLIEESQKISGILEMMNQIASSTHVLSINASIVAARAGVHGRAFDVVSKEIRALAQNTASSLANIETIVHEIQDRIVQVAQRTKNSSLSILGEKNTLLSVAGSLQGVILAVEVIRSVSSVSSEKAMQLERDAAAVSSSLDLLASSVRRDDTKNLADTIFKRLDDLEKRIETDEGETP